MAPACPRCGKTMTEGAQFCGSCGAYASPGSPGSPATGPQGFPGPPPALPPRYEVRRMLGRGGMGRVYLCFDRQLHVEVAVKVLPAELLWESEAVAQIEREARTSARVRGCPQILSLYGMEQFGETRFLVMEYAAGGSLRDRMRKQLFSEEECRRIGAEVADALGFAHKKGVLHRDIKPSNVLLDAEGRARVADFGLSKALSDASTRMSTSELVGTPAYLPPEVLHKLPFTAAADLYSLGCMLFEMSTGKAPFGGSMAEVAASKLVLGTPPPDPRDLRPGLSPEFAAIVRRLLMDRAEERYRDAAACAAALRGRPVPEAEPRSAVRRFLPASPVLRAAVAAGGLLVLGGGAFLAFRGVGAAPPPEAPPAPGPGPASSPPSPPAARPPAPPSPAPVANDPVTPTAPKAPRGPLVLTTPPGARILVDGVEAGVAGPDGLRLDLAEGKRCRVRALLEEHEPAEADAEAVAGPAGAAPPLRLSLRRLQGHLRIAGGPPGATVTIASAGQPARYVPLGADGSLGPLPLDSGDYDLFFTQQGFEPRQARVHLKGGATETVDAKLVERDGALTLDSVPQGAQVSEEGTVLGTTPLRAHPLKAGTHRLLLTHPRRVPTTVEVTVRGERTTEAGSVTLTLPGVLDLTQLPDDVKASVGGKPLPRERVSLPPGTVAVLLEKEECRPQTVEVSIRADQVQYLRPKPWVPLPGSLDLAALPADVAVLVDGVPAARGGSGARVEVPSGEHQVDLVMTGKANAVHIMKVPPGATVAVKPPASWRAIALKPAVKKLDPPPPQEIPPDLLPPGYVARDRRVWCERDGAEMVFLPATEFEMGARDGKPDELPVRRVSLSPFLMDRHEVTTAQFDRFVKETGYRTEAEAGGFTFFWNDEGEWDKVIGGDWQHPLGPRSNLNKMEAHPVTSVSWNDAAAYCRWAGKRLPTEAEFEAALRCGRVGQKYPWGEAGEVPPRAGNLADETVKKKSLTIPRWIVLGYEDGFERTAPVGSFPANPLGILDLVGNVGEWCSDWYEAKVPEPPGGKVRDPSGPDSGTARSLRGSHWCDVLVGLRAAERRSASPNHRADTLGFRTCRSVP